MKTREVTTYRGEDFTLTEDEEKYIRALERLSKMPAGRIELFAYGSISVRLGGIWHNDNIDNYVKVDITCEGGDGGDNC